MFPIDSKSFFEIPAHGDRQLKVRQRAICQVRLHEPAKSPQPLEASRTDGRDFACQKARGIHQMTAMGQHKVPAFISFWVAGGTLRLRARSNNSLQVVGHRITKSAVTVQGAES